MTAETDAPASPPVATASPAANPGGGGQRHWLTDLPWWLFAATAPLSVFVAQFATWCMVVHAVVVWRRRGYAAARPLAGIWIVTLLIGLSALASAIASPWGYAACANGLAKLWPLVLLPMVAIVPPDERPSSRALLIMMLIAFLPSAGLGLYQAITLTDPVRSTVLTGRLGYGATFEWVRARGAATNALTFAGQAAIAALIGLALALHARDLKWRWRLLATGAALAAGMSLWLSTSRSYLLGALLAAVLLASLRGVRIAIALWLLLPVGVGALLILGAESPRVQRFLLVQPVTLKTIPDDEVRPWYGGNPAEDRFIIEMVSSEQRIPLWCEALWLIAQRPWLGHGPDGGWVEALRSRQIQMWKPYRPHPNVMLPDRLRNAWSNSQNMQLHTLGETGLIGFALAGVWVLLVIYALVPGWSVNRPLWLATAGIWMVLTVASLVENSFTDMELRLVWLVLTGLLLSDILQQQRTTTDRNDGEPERHQPQP